MIDRKIIFTATIFGLAGHCYGASPNIVYVFPDQFRNSSMAFWGDEHFSDSVRFRPDPVVTPNLDRFSRQSVVLTEAVSNCPVSSPHRGMLLSGLYPERNGVTLNCMALRPESNLKADVECISDVLSKVGYQCAYIGKLHTDFPTKNNPQRPGTYVGRTTPEWDAYTPKERRHGFDYWYSYGTFDVHKHPHYWDSEGKRHDVDQWSPKHEVDKAIEYIANRDKDKPFFMMLSMNPPHSPYTSTEDCMQQDFDVYKGKSKAELLVRDNADTTMAKSASAAYYFANVTGVDREFGRLLEALTQAGLDDNTIVVFSSDHGETMCSQGVVDPKNSIYRESFNVPFMIRYPDVLAAKIDPVLLSTVDIMPTLLSLAGHSQSAPKGLQGRDLAPLLKGESDVRPTAALYIRNLDGKRDADKMVSGIFPQARGVKTAHYTMEISIDRGGKLSKVKLFDDINDPYQMKNIFSSLNDATFKSLCQELAEVLRRADDIWYRDGILKHIVPYKYN